MCCCHFIKSVFLWRKTAIFSASFAFFSIHPIQKQKQMISYSQQIFLRILSPPATSALAFPVHSSPLRSLLVHPLKRTYINNVGGIEGVRRNLGLGRREGCHHFLPLLEFEKLSSTFIKLVSIIQPNSRCLIMGSNIVQAPIGVGFIYTFWYSLSPTSSILEFRL